MPAEAVYAVFESKQSANAAQVEYAEKKIASVRALKRTSLPIPHAAGIAAAKRPKHILGGLLTLEADWTPAFGPAFRKALSSGRPGRLDLGCVAARGTFQWKDRRYVFVASGKPATRFLFTLISDLQRMATVPMIDVQAYARWLKE